MASPILKPDADTPASHPGDADIFVPVSIEGQPIDPRLHPKHSPAKHMQDRLAAHFSPMGQKMSARFVTLLVMLTCLGSWAGGLGPFARL